MPRVAFARSVHMTRNADAGSWVGGVNACSLSVFNSSFFFLLAAASFCLSVRGFFVFFFGFGFGFAFFLAFDLAFGFALARFALGLPGVLEELPPVVLGPAFTALGAALGLPAEVVLPV